jgi:hypothetical protein
MTCFGHFFDVCQYIRRGTLALRNLTAPQDAAWRGLPQLSEGEICRGRGHGEILRQAPSHHNSAACTRLTNF